MNMIQKLTKVSETELGWVASTQRYSGSWFLIEGPMFPNEAAARTAAEAWIRLHPSWHLTTEDAEFYGIVQ